MQPAFKLDAEAMNKDLILSQKCGLTFARDAVAFIGSFCLLPAKDQVEKVMSKNSLVMYDILRIFEAIIYDRRDSTVPESLVIVLKWLSNHVSFSIMKTLLRSQSQCVVFRTLVIMNCIFQGMGTREHVAEYQRLILNHSTLVLRNIELLLLPVSKRQKQISVVFLYNCLNNEPSAASLMTRIIPKSLFRKVDSTSNDISKWTLIQWEELFSQINSNFSTAIEQWNDECRSELIQKLRQAQNDYEEHWQVLDANRFNTLLEAVAKSRDGQLENSKSNSLLQLRWNFEEYEVKYSVLEKQLPVWKYYLEQLYDETANPSLKIVINNAKKLWEELSIQLISREDMYIRKKILQTMILVYKEYYEKIKELSLIPFLIKVLAQEEDDSGSFHYLILQLLCTAMDVNDHMISHQNIRKFNEKGGLQVIRAHLARNFFFENLDEIDYETIKNTAIERAATRRGVTSYASTPIVSRAISMTHIARPGLKESITYNFSSADLPREAYSPVLKKSNEIFLCLNIIKTCIARTKSQSEDLMLFPRPLARQMVSEKETVNLFNQLLLIKDSTIVAIVQEIINLAYFNRFSYKHILTGTNYYERSIHGMHNMTVGEIVAKNFRDLFFLVQNDAAEELKKLLGRFATFGYLDSDIDDTETERERVLKDKLFDLYPLFKTLPWQMVYILVRRGGPEEFVRNFYSKKFEHPRLLWIEDMRHQLLTEMREKFKGEFDRLKANHEKFIQGKLSMGIFEPLFQPSRVIEYKAVLKELVCDNVFLRIWILPEHDDFDLDEAQTPRIILKLNRMLDKKVDTLINDPNVSVAVTLIEKIKEIYVILKANLKILKKYQVASENQLATLHKLLELWSGYVFDSVNSENSCNINLWELVIKNAFKIVGLFLNRASKENVEDFRKNKNIRTSILRVASLIVNKVLHDNWCSFNYLRILCQFARLLKGLQMNMVNLVDMFQDVDTEKNDIYDICTLLNFCLHPYHLYFSYMMVNKYSIIFENNRVVTTDVVKRSIYVVYEMKDLVDMKDSPPSPRRDTVYGTQYQMDPALTNIIDYFKLATFVTGFNFEVEDRLLRMTADVLDIVTELSETPTCATYLVRSRLFYRLFQIGLYYIPREVRSSPESMQDSCFQLIDNFKSLSDQAFKALIHLVIMFLEGSINAGHPHLDELLKDVENTAFNKIKENADTIRFEDNKKLEEALVSARRFLGDATIRGLISVYLEPDRVDLFRDDLISAPDVSQERKDSLSSLHPVQADKLRVDVAEVSNNVQGILEIVKKTPVSHSMALERRSIVQTQVSDLTIRGIIISSYVHNPFRIEGTAEFVLEASEKLLGTERRSHQNLIFLLKAINCVIRDEPDFEISQLVVDRLILLYAQVEAEWGDIRNLIADLFYALSILMINLKREAGWVSSLSFNRLLLKIFLDFNGTQSEEAYQLMIKWAHVISQLINTEAGMKAIATFQILLGLSKVVFESSFPVYIRNKMAESIVRLYAMMQCPPEFKAMLDVIFEVCATKDGRTGEALVKIIDKEQVNPSFVFTKLTSYRNREKYNRELNALVEKIDGLIVSMPVQGTPALAASFKYVLVTQCRLQVRRFRCRRQRGDNRRYGNAAAHELLPPIAEIQAKRNLLLDGSRCYGSRDGDYLQGREPWKGGGS